MSRGEMVGAAALGLWLTALGLTLPAGAVAAILPASISAALAIWILRRYGENK